MPWDLDGDGQFDDATIAKPSWTYAYGRNHHRQAPDQRRSRTHHAQ